MGSKTVRMLLLAGVLVVAMYRVDGQAWLDLFPEVTWFPAFSNITIHMGG
ncbi:MAG: hypothetical protein M1274_11280 [Actinobacteria bacterium]|nr:hypothetical protein [Actinomycetota bacterium]